MECMVQKAPGFEGLTAFGCQSNRTKGTGDVEMNRVLMHSTRMSIIITLLAWFASPNKEFGVSFPALCVQGTNFRSETEQHVHLTLNYKLLYARPV